MRLETWWFEHIVMYHDYQGILYAVASVYPQSEMENYQEMAEQVWAMNNGLA